MTDLSTMTQERWESIPRYERLKIRDESSLSPLLIDKEGAKVQIVLTDGTIERFRLGISTGWRPVHLKMANSRALGSSDIVDPKIIASVRVI